MPGVAIDPLDVLYLLYPGHGHVTPNLATIAELVRRGHRVHALTGDGFVAPVQRAGATVGTLDPPLPPPPNYAGMTLERWGEESFAQFLGMVVSTPSLLRDATARGGDVVVYDSPMWAPARLISARLGVPAVEMCPTLLAHRPFTPETMRGGAEPDPEGERERLVAFGDDLVTLMGEHGLPGLARDDFAPRDDECTVVHVPREFQDAPERFGDDVHFVGPSVDAPTGSWSPPEGAGPVLLLSLGTSSNDQPELFASCVEAFADSRWYVVMTLGDGVDPGVLGDLPRNVEAHPWLPHAEVLAHASAAVSHGGMGSVLEALAVGVPLVAIPTHPEAMNNGRRVAETGLGRCIPHDAISGPAIRAAVEDVVADREVAQRLGAMRAAMARAGGPRSAADIVERSATAHPAVHAGR